MGRKPRAEVRKEVRERLGRDLAALLGVSRATGGVALLISPQQAPQAEPGALQPEELSALACLAREHEYDADLLTPEQVIRCLYRCGYIRKPEPK